VIVHRRYRGEEGEIACLESMLGTFTDLASMLTSTPSPIREEAKN
jgi:hypothetical protein